MNHKFFNYLGLAMRAGKLVTGDESVLKTVRSGEAKLVVMATDASVNMQKKYRDKCGTYEVPLLEFGTRSELGSSIGKDERVLIAVTDGGFARMLQSCQANLAEVKDIEQNRQ
ncbi:50S ribosomal protein L7ae [Gordoniibacillus kamchatkensis]|uniref:50S ribosomal protein L7ae n=1 Tax=Gordoniibacillus kamchatkensis TaxID=1590651 RepID=A0ABR5AFR2_9BACL|nr:YlxQ family RNA-binding protein [Paenibacillus sp. VKM B-2647]KIL39207.1 50S ribosomal protein L7ae [Paenibacillus sp. VKM B-2647]